MDRHPQSKERGITIDLGFSSFMLPDSGDAFRTQITLVDCPGHAGLIKTVLAGAQIIDMCILVLDAQKGFQAQTVESVVIAEILTSRLVVVVNKIDLIADRENYLIKTELGIRKTMAKTCFGSNFPMAFVSATMNDGMDSLIQKIAKILENPPPRSDAGGFHFAFDHCFNLKGQGTIFTGTVLSGKVRKGQKVIIPDSNDHAEVRSIQSFKCPVVSACQGDRVGICLPGISSNGRERGEICDVNACFFSTNVALCVIRRIKQFKGSLNQSKLHITMGHTQCMASAIFLNFSGRERSRCPVSQTAAPGVEIACLGSGKLTEELEIHWELVNKILHEGVVDLTVVEDVSAHSPEEPLLCVLFLDRNIRLRSRALFVASRLDLNEDHQGCRIAFFGRIIQTELSQIQSRVIKEKVKEGRVERVLDSSTCLVEGILSKGGDASRIVGLSVSDREGGISGKIESTFGKSGLVRVKFETQICSDLVGTKVFLRTRQEALRNIIDSHLG